MIATIDGTGRPVVPKAIRDRLHLGAGSQVEVDEHDGIVTIGPRAAEVELVVAEGGLVAVPTDEVAPLAAEVVRATLDVVRR